MQKQSRNFLALGALFGFIAVAAGAFGAHGLKNAITPERLDIFKVAAHYQLVHAVLLVVIGMQNTSLDSSRHLRMAGWFFVAGILIFSGSLYLLVLLNQGWMGAITPIGGMALLAGWVTLFVSALRSR